ncbi:hypothetical protein M2451_001569 [Dysgonomonas sp. PFB1-18]|uniref:DUF3836 domain-containing protein n=1 Tax=unclassified Dysgonomonas TaxID=2630389 RepID=UPI00247601BB|nr:MULTISPECIES: DUF3836 domain-containing protein [unclassified Dysgonomonas]MDH6308973.1 hypothetical protein [Dysgonomonas sp. PF1-14]MDH6338724.1 hypothetical protein [Dysgonomonas sp. PF1-16]MDH6380248.1 hypothetical protein [Dysgonomonas sp. PFB1-18]MDH6397578.1 hypothetical protein [Dysgonomonas sp. PF1-23]
MKAIILTSVFAALTFTADLNARNVKTYINEEQTALGLNKEYISVDKNSQRPETRTNYMYDADGRMTKKTISRWIDEAGWVSVSKIEYNYGEGDLVSYATHTKWDKNTENWSTKSDCQINIYGSNNELLTIKRMEIDSNIRTNLITQK